MLEDTLASGIEIRELGGDVLAALQRDLPSPHHVRRAAAHASGAATMLVALHGQAAAGCLLVKWAGADEQIVHELIGECPELNAITVAPSLRSRGIGSALVEAAERLIAARGQSRVGLAVGIDNRRARALYERLGYRDWGHGAFEVSWDVSEPPPRRERETCVYMLKALTSVGPC
jgi:ribosomal protein S18 acetylase RimI-like enzyme